jgi:two-component system, LytTR family, response regulator
MLELLDNPPHIIFTTAFDEYAMQAFEANAIDYLLKPFSQERFNKAISKWNDSKSNKQQPAVEQLMEQVSKHPSHAQRVVVKTGTKIKIIPFQDIHYLEAADDYVKIVTAESSFLKKSTMSYFEQVLDTSSFIRIHRSYILNIQQITRIDAYEKENHLAILASGAKIPVSRSGYPKLKTILGL